MMDYLLAEAQLFGVKLNPSHLDAFERYFHELVDWNSRVNLTAITSYEDVQRKHYADSLICVLALPGLISGETTSDASAFQHDERSIRVVDVGSGSGFPGLPLKIVFPTIRLTLIEATAKKTAFLQHIVSLLQMTDVDIVCARAEEAGQDHAQREQYDVVLARAVASLPVLAEYCLPLLRVGGRWIAQKGDGIAGEVLEMNEALRVLGGELQEVKPYHLSQIPGTRNLIVVDKVSTTPPKYPRRVGIPSKRPLRSET
ncbi:MAG: 16S rRNA (guanine(527)-N(7))-methyltransferase RsmG [Anaerolineae bacterium]